MANQSSQERVFTYKRCPYCFTNLKLEVEACHSCHKKVGAVDRYGLAKKPVNVVGYMVAFLWVGIFAGYIWYAFLR